MEEQRTDYIHATSYERSDDCTSEWNGYYNRELTTRVGTLELKVRRTRDAEFSPTVFERYQRKEKAHITSILEIYISGVYTQKVFEIVEELCGKSVFKYFDSRLTEELESQVFEWKTALYPAQYYLTLLPTSFTSKLENINAWYHKAAI